MTAITWLDFPSSQNKPLKPDLVKLTFHSYGPTFLQIYTWVKSNTEEKCILHMLNMNYFVYYYFSCSRAEPDHYRRFFGIAVWCQAKTPNLTPVQSLFFAQEQVAKGEMWALERNFRKYVLLLS